MTGTKGGIEAYIRELYKNMPLSDAHHTYQYVGYASSELFNSDTSWFPGEIINSGVSGENRLSWALAEIFLVAKKARQIRANLIHAPAMFGPWFSSIPVVVTFHDLSYFTHPQLMRNRLLTPYVKLMERIGAWNAKRIISISQATSNALLKYLNIPLEKIDLVYSSGRPQAHVQRETSPKKDLFLAMGQRSPYKSLETAILAINQIPEEHRPQLVITGSHGDDPLLALVDELHLEKFVKLLEWVSNDELAELLSTCTALIETTVAAGFGMPALEAMEIGVPVIISDIEVFREIAGENALYFKPGDPQSLAGSIQRISSNSELIKKLSIAGPLRAREFSWKKCAAGTVQSFKKALSEHNS